MIDMKLIDLISRRGRHLPRRGGRWGLVACLASLVLFVAAASAAAAPVWQVKSMHGPQNFVPGGTGQYVITAENVGDAPTDGTTPTTVTDTLPPGVTATGYSGPDWNCTGVGTGTMSCQNLDVVDYIDDPNGPGNSQSNAAPVLYIDVAIDPSASGTADNAVTIDGGDPSDPSASTTDPTPFSTTPAGFGIVPGSLVADVFDAAVPGGNPVRQAGAHPSEMRVRFDFNEKLTTDSLGTYSEPDEHVRTIDLKLPPGLIGNPQATPQCTPEQMITPVTQRSGACPVSSQVGVATVLIQNANQMVANDVPGLEDFPVYNMTPQKGAVAALAFEIYGRPVWITASLDPTDYSVVTRVQYTSDVFYIRSTDLTLWGVPADPSHDPLRFDPNANQYGASVAGDVVHTPFLTLPSLCGVPASPQVSVDSWEHPGAMKSYDGSAITMTGCDAQQFSATLRAQPTNRSASSPTGLSVDLNIPQNENPVGLGTPPLKDASVTLPEGMAISPSSADGLLGCSPAQIGLGTNDDPTCPDASKIGTVSIVTPLLHDPLTGHVYLASQNDNPFGSTLALYLVAQGPGVTIKLAGRVSPDPVTGQLTTTFDNNPMLPFSNLHLQFDSGARAPLVTPPTCGVKTTQATLTPWNLQLPAVQSTDSFTIDGNCARGFDPGFAAGTTNPVAGHDSPLVTRFTRGDGDQELSKIDVTLPKGVLGRIASLVLCPDSAANAGTCEDSSKIGTATVAAGAGSNPFYITDGRVYMTGPYKGAPFGLSIVVHAKAGPLDLGNVVVRSAVFVDKRTAQLRVVSDPLPAILQGIPLDLRVVDITVDRSGFTFNPTNCSVMSAAATLTSTSGATSTKSSRFQVGECGALPFAPKLSIAVGGRGHTGNGASTPLTATVQMPRGDANLRDVKVSLPTTINARLNVINKACTLAEFQAGNCAKAKAGTAVAVTPLLRDPLRGNVYFVRNGHALPDMMVALRGQVAIDLDARITIRSSKYLTTDFAVPDVPVTKFALRLVSGKQGPVGAAANLCTARSRKAKMGVTMVAQSGKVVRRSQALSIHGCAKPKAKGGKARGR